MIEVLHDIVESTVGKKVAFTETTHFTNDDILDSLDSSVFLLEIEKKFNIKLDDEFVEENNLFLVSNLIEYIEKNSN